jgi:hypothetical protein
LSPASETHPASRAESRISRKTFQNVSNVAFGQAVKSLANEGFPQLARAVQRLKRFEPFFAFCATAEWVTVPKEGATSTAM